MAEPVLAMWKKGTETHRSPLFVEDLTSGIMAALDDPATQGQIIEAMGPDKFLQVRRAHCTMVELYREGVTKLFYQM